MKSKLLLPILLIVLAALQGKAQQPKFIELYKIDSLDFSETYEYFKDKVLIGAGESTHGTHEFFLSKIQLFQYLVKTHNFNTFFLEADYANCYALDKYVKGSVGNPEDLVKEIKLWPWITSEMVDLIKWIKTHNTENPDKLISIIGVDMQKIEKTTSSLISILQDRAPKSLIELESMSSLAFFYLKKGEIKKRLLPIIDDLANVDTSIFTSPSELQHFKRLSRHFGQIVKGKLSSATTYRDLRMAENIMLYLENESNAKGFFWAHNTHIANFYDAKKQNGTAGGLLKHKLKDAYFSLGQEFYEGSFNVYFKDKAKGNDQTPEDYTLGAVTVGPAAEGSFAANFIHSFDLPLFIPFEYLPENEEVNISNIGARYILNDDPKSIWRYNHHGQEAFDAIILIGKSTPTLLLDN